METDIGQPTILIPVSMNLNVWYMHHSLRHTRRNIRASARRKIDGGLLFSTYDTLCNANLSGRWAILYLPGRCMSYLSLFLILFLIHGPRTPSVLNNKPGRMNRINIKRIRNCAGLPLTELRHIMRPPRCASFTVDQHAESRQRNHLCVLPFDDGIVNRQTKVSSGTLLQA